MFTFLELQSDRKYSKVNDNPFCEPLLCLMADTSIWIFYHYTVSIIRNIYHGINLIERTKILVSHSALSIVNWPEVIWYMTTVGNFISHPPLENCIEYHWFLCVLNCEGRDLHNFQSEMFHLTICLVAMDNVNKIVRYQLWSFWFKCDFGQKYTTHPKFNPTRVRTHDL